MWNLVIWMQDSRPETIKAVDTRYCVSAAERLTPPGPDRMMGGVIMPANMARACWSPSSRARNTGILSLRPKKGGTLSDFFMNGRLGRKRKT